MKRFIALLFAILFVWVACIALLCVEAGEKIHPQTANANIPTADATTNESGAESEIQPPAPQTETPVDVSRLSRIDGCTVTYYCCELYEHICGDGDGYTATGTEVTAGRSCAVDPILIPLGSTVWVDFGDGELHEYIAEDVGSAVNGAHIDLAVETHAEAWDCGVDYATVYWE